MKDMVSFVGKYWRRGLVPVLFLLVSTVVSFVYPMFPRWAIDNVVMPRRFDLLPILALSFLGLIVMQRVFAYLNEITFFNFQKSTILEIQKELLERVFRYPMDFFDKNHSGYLLGRIRGDVAGLSYIFSEGLVTLLMDVLRFSAGIAILLAMHARLTLIALTILPFLIVSILRSKPHIRKINERILEENARIERELSDTLQGIEVLKSFSRESEGLARSQKALADFQQIEVKRNRVVAVFHNWIDLIIHGGEVLLLYFGIREVLYGRLTVGQYMAFVGYLAYIYAPVKNISYFTVFIDYAKRSYKRIRELLDILPEESGSGKPFPIREIDVRDLGFSYEEQRTVIRGVNFRLGCGERLLLRGESGSGKSTLVKLLLGLYRPRQGSIHYNGTDLREIDKRHLRERIGYISQNIFFFHKSLRENLLLGSDGISDRQLLEILEQCRLPVDLLTEKTSGEGSLLDRCIAEKGGNFSGGEKQRIALARALIKNPDVVILDEATANINRETESEIERFILERFGDRIIIKISHKAGDETGWDVLELPRGEAAAVGEGA